MNARRVVIVLLAGSLPVTPVRALAASFDCAKARTAVEKLICGDARLSHLDEQLAEAYRSALAGAINPDTLRAEQRDWLRTKPNICPDAGCLEDAYERRLATLAAAAPGPAAEETCPEAGWSGLGGEVHLALAGSWREVYKKVAPRARRPANEDEAKHRACRISEIEKLEDAPCKLEDGLYKAETKPFNDSTFRGERLLIIPAGKQLVLYGPIEEGGRLENLFNSEAHVTGSLAVIEHFHSSSEGDPGGDAADPVRDMVVVDLATLRFAKLTGPSLAAFRVRSTGKAIMVEGAGCRVTVESAEIAAGPRR